VLDAHREKQGIVFTELARERLATCDRESLRVFSFRSGELESARPVPDGRRVVSLAASPSANVVAVTLSAGKVGAQLLEVWDADGWQPVATLKEHTGFVHRPLFLRNGKLLVTAATDATIRLWSTDDWRYLDVIDISSSKGRHHRPARAAGCGRIPRDG
jgi:WD40 repeat protein